MKTSGPEISANELEASSTSPPDWFLKRRARQAAVLQKQHESEMSNSDSAEMDGSPISEPRDTIAPDYHSSDSVTEKCGFGETATSTPSKKSLDVDLDDDIPGNIYFGDPVVTDFSVDSKANDSGSDETSFPDFTAPAPAVAARPAKIAIPSDEEDEEDDLTPFQVFMKRWFGTDAIGSYTISLLLHLMAALLLSIVVFHEELENAALSTLMAISDEPANPILDDSVIQIDTSGGQTGEVEQDLFSAKSVAAIDPLSSTSMTDDFDSKTTKEGEGQGNGIGDGLNLGGFQMPEGGKAVRKGSFTVWTVPADPKPGQDYLIVIQVKYKKPNQKLNKSDITGLVRGTDRFRLAISPETTRIVPNASQVVVEIPGAAFKVRDTIKVQSALLRESQNLTIEF